MEKTISFNCHAPSTTQVTWLGEVIWVLSADPQGETAQSQPSTFAFLSSEKCTDVCTEQLLLFHRLFFKFKASFSLLATVWNYGLNVFWSLLLSSLKRSGNLFPKVIITQKNNIFFQSSQPHPHNLSQPIVLIGNIICNCLQIKYKL